mmetsp:Transcript_13161/g.37580  ORF Transcript_13161/g.37580 Transcript_13161/m.37580 type:complete len:233 (-) Transcript_13161:982-1680(-)
MRSPGEEVMERLGCAGGKPAHICGELAEPSLREEVQGINQCLLSCIPCGGWRRRLCLHVAFPHAYQVAHGWRRLSRRCLSLRLIGSTVTIGHISADITRHSRSVCNRTLSRVAADGTLRRSTSVADRPPSRAGHPTRPRRLRFSQAVLNPWRPQGLRRYSAGTRLALLSAFQAVLHGLLLDLPYPLHTYGMTPHDLTHCLQRWRPSAARSQCMALVRASIHVLLLHFPAVQK